jgi:hypothetical protein
VNWAVEPTSLESVGHEPHEPSFDFVEHAITHGSVFRIARTGYFIVAPERSPVSGFVCALKLPRLGDAVKYAGLLESMRERSTGMMWYEAGDSNCFDFVWRLQLSIRASCPLFELSPTRHPPSSGLFRVVRGRHEHLSEAVKLLASISSDVGGQSPAETMEHLENGNLYVAEDGGTIVGSAAAVPHGRDWMWIRMLALRPESRARRTGERFVLALSAIASQQNRRLVFGVARESTAAFALVSRLGARIIKTGYTACLL